MLERKFREKLEGKNESSKLNYFKFWISGAKKIKSRGAKSKKYRITSKFFIISGCAPAPPRCSAAPPLDSRTTIPYDKTHQA
jgi:hypothetical protein